MVLALYKKWPLCIVWNYYYLVSSSFIDSLLAQIYLLFISICIILGSTLCDLLQEVTSDFARRDLSACLWMIIIIYQYHWLIFSFLLRSVCRFFLYFFKGSMFIQIDHKEYQFLSIAYCICKIIVFLLFSFILFFYWLWIANKLHLYLSL